MALKKAISGLTTTETTTEFALDEETGKMKAIKKKVNEKNIPPNTDLLKLIYQKLTESETDYSTLTDEQLETEKQRLLLQLKEQENASRKNGKKD